MPSSLPRTSVLWALKDSRRRGPLSRLPCSAMREVVTPWSISPLPSTMYGAGRRHSPMAAGKGAPTWSSYKDTLGLETARHWRSAQQTQARRGPTNVDRRRLTLIRSQSDWASLTGCSTDFQPSRLQVHPTEPCQKRILGKWWGRCDSAKGPNIPCSTSRSAL